MSVKQNVTVQMTSVCDGCGAEAVHEQTYQYVPNGDTSSPRPPAGWASFYQSYWGEKPGQSTKHTHGVLCPSCADRAAAVLPWVSEASS